MRVLVVAHPRSGSSNLYEMLQLHPELNILEEPFNENFVDWDPGNPNYRERIHDAASLDAVLDEILTSFDGLKVLGYQLPEDLIEHLLLLPELRVVFLRRRNLLQAVVSNLISEQTGLWKKWDMNRPLESYYEGLRPLDVADVRRRTRSLSRHLASCDSILDRRCDDRVFKLVYEDLYFAQPAEQSERMAAVYRFLDLGPPPLADLEYYLRPESTKLNSVATYAFVPNAREIDALCGSDLTGWLFDRPAAAPPT